MMPEQHLSDNDKAYLLSLARQSIESKINKHALPAIDFKALPPILKSNGASFVTLTYKGYLRGCIGALEPYQSLAEDVQEHALAAAFEDYRFLPVQAGELNDIKIEISYLTSPVRVNYSTPEELTKVIRPGIDGVVLRDGLRRATFLPQVWEKIPDPDEFLDQLCVKMGASPGIWRKKVLEVLTYQVEEFHE